MCTENVDGKEKVKFEYGFKNADVASAKKDEAGNMVTYKNLY